MRMKNGDLYSFLENYDQLSNITGLDLIDAIAKNKEMIEKEIERIESIKEESDKIKELNEKITEKYMFYTDKNPDGSPKVKKVHDNTGRYREEPSISKPKKEKLDKDINKLKEEYKKYIDEYNDNLEKYTQELENESTLKFKKVKKEIVPNYITLRQYELLKFMIEG